MDVGWNEYKSWLAEALLNVSLSLSASRDDWDIWAMMKAKQATRRLDMLKRRFSKNSKALR